ncbi:hypothetical protein [Microcoleus sp. B4-D4]|uniref:hypothetical protein n=1 Tax=Microcoleus sp. B4-D4 TaxID=2818667 RepID=UPI002FD43FFF
MAIGFSLFFGLKVSDLFFYPYFFPHPNIAFLTRTFQILCSVPVVVCAFTYGLAKTLQPRHPATKFILCSALLTGGFLLNEIYIIHIYMIRLGIPKLGVCLLYAVVLFSYGWVFQRELKETPYQILLAGVALLFWAIAIDSLHLKNKILASLLEGVPKLYIAILNDYTRYQALPGNAYPEALPPLSQPRQSLWTSVPRQSLGTS